jgi:hypothetical protein
MHALTLSIAMKNLTLVYWNSTGRTKIDRANCSFFENHGFIVKPSYVIAQSDNNCKPLLAVLSSQYDNQ